MGRCDSRKQTSGNEMLGHTVAPAHEGHKERKGRGCRAALSANLERGCGGGRAKAFSVEALGCHPFWGSTPSHLSDIHSFPLGIGQVETIVQPIELIQTTILPASVDTECETGDGQGKKNGNGCFLASHGWTCLSTIQKRFQVIYDRPRDGLVNYAL